MDRVLSHRFRALSLRWAAARERVAAVPRVWAIPGRACVCGLIAVLAAVPGGQGIAGAQSCVTQARATAAQRASTGAVAYRLATAVQRGDTAAVKTDSIAQLSGDFGATASLIGATAAGLTGDSLAVQQLYLLDASTRSPTETTDADFACALAGTAAETDFSIAGLPPGKYAFLMVTAAGPQPWALSFLLQAEGTGWKMAGFYPHRTAVAGHDGLWYWTTARADTKTGKPWLAFLYYGEADQLLRPANFVGSTNLFRLRSELRSSTPPDLANGPSDTAPLTIQEGNGTAYRITGLSSDSSPNGKELDLLVHLRAEGNADGNNEATAALARDLAAGDALLRAHPELRTGFNRLVVISEAPGTNPVLSDRPMAEVAAGK